MADKVYVKDKDVSVKESFLVPNREQQGRSVGYSMRTTYDEAAKYADPNTENLNYFSTFPMTRITPGGSYLFGNGTVSAPSISFVADSDTGFYKPAASILGTSIDGVEVSRWTSFGLYVAGVVNVGTTTDADSAGELAAGITSSGRMHFFRRFAGDGLINDGGATELNDGALTIYGTAANEYINVTSYSAGHSIGFRNPYGQLEFHTNLGGGWQPIALLGGYATYSALELRNVADTDCIYMQFHTTNGPAIMTQVYTQLDFGIALTRNIRLTATDLSPITTGAVSLGLVSKAWANGYFSTLLDVNSQHSISTTAVSFNETGGNVDFKIEGDTNTELFYVDASADFIGFGTSGPLAFLHIQKSGGGTVGGLTRGQLHFNPVTATNDLTHAITFGAHDGSGVNTSAQAGIYVQSSGAYGTRMYFATSSSFGSGAVAKWNIQESGHFLAVTDNSYDIGASSATRPRTGYFGTSLNVNAQHILSTTSAVINETQADVDFRVEGDSISHLIFTDATSTTENIALCATAAPNWQSMDRGIFIENRETSPTGNPTSGFFYYSDSGQPTWRDDGGVTYSLTQATGGQNVTNNVTDSGSTAGTIPDITDGVTYANDYTNLRRALFQIARMLKQDHDQLRAMGILT
jgi:hypothetical protein